MDSHSSDLDPHTAQPDHTLKPLIKELVRTQVCFPNLKLLVDKVTIVVLQEHETAAGNEAYRLFLTDGEKTIQALLKRRIHKTMISFGIYEGSYVVLKKYHLAKAKKLAGGVVIYIVIDDFHSVGEDERENPRIEYYYQYLSSSRDGRRWPAIRRGEFYSPFSDPSEECIQSQDAEKATLDCDFDEDEPLEEVSLIPMPSSITSTPTKRKREIPLGENPNVASRWNSAAKLAQELEGPGDKCSISPSSQRSSCLSESLPATPTKRRRTSSRPRQSSSNDASIRSQMKDEKSTAVIHTAENRPTAPFPKHYQTPFSQEHTLDELAAEDPSKNDNSSTLNLSIIHSPTYHPTQLGPSPLPHLPHPLVPLSHISFHRRRNTTYSILCLVYSITPVLPSPLGPKRDLRIVDPSTTKKVLLSIFMEPERFLVGPGKVVLFRGVTTHEWEGGMVSAYPKMCRGLGVWYVVEPERWDLGPLRAWWSEKYRDGAEQEGQG